MKIQVSDMMATAYEFGVSGYSYKLHYHNGKWSAIRWKSEQPRIPPRTDILTEDGWVNLLKEYVELRLPLESLLEKLNEIEFKETK